MNQLRKIAAIAASETSGEAQPSMRDLSRLSEEADGLLRKLVHLRESLHAVRAAARDVPPSPELAATNEQFFRAALHAEAVAETAVTRLGELAWSSQHDALTGLPNRSVMFDRLETAIAAASRNETRIGVMFIDLDAFKQINDTLGHSVGDEALRLTARRLRGVLRKSDSVGRHGGEEFVVLLPDIASAVDAGQVAGKLLAALAAPSKIAGHRVDLSASIGIAMYPEDGEHAQLLVDRADAAMYRAKRCGPGRFEFYARKRSLHQRKDSPNDQ